LEKDNRGVASSCRRGSIVLKNVTGESGTNIGNGLDGRRLKAEVVIETVDCTISIQYGTL
jgi:hypothetical protein